MLRESALTPHLPIGRKHVLLSTMYTWELVIPLSRIKMAANQLSGGKKKILSAFRHGENLSMSMKVLRNCISLVLLINLCLRI